MTYLHDEVGVAHSSVDGQLGQRGATVLLHGLEDGLGLEACGLEGGAGNVAALSKGSDTKDGASGIVNPVGGKQTRKGSDKGAAAVVGHCLGQGTQL